MAGIRKVPNPSDPSRAALEPQIRHLYDHQLVGIAQSAPINYFTTGFGGQGRNRADTNLPSVPLPSPSAFVVSGFGVHLVQRPVANGAMVLTDITDAMTMLNNGLLQFFVGNANKVYVNGPCYAFPSGFGLTGAVATGAATAAGATATLITNGVPVAGNYYKIPGQPILLNNQEYFAAEIAFPRGAIAMSTSQTLAVWLRGTLGTQIN
jgi:hypothetical protein